MKLFIAWAADMALKYEKVFSIIDIEKERLDKWHIGGVVPSAAYSEVPSGHLIFPLLGP